MLNEDFKDLTNGLEGLFQSLGMPTLEKMVNEYIDPSNRYSYIKGYTLKGKNRTFKKKKGKFKRVLYRDYFLDESIYWRNFSSRNRFIFGF